MVKVDGTEQRPVARVGDIELYRWDVDLLQPRQWLNDALIAFVFEHMTQGLSEADGVVLIEPTVAFSAAMVPPDVLGEMLSGGPSGQERLARLRQARLVRLTRLPALTLQEVGAASRQRWLPWIPWSSR